VQDVDQVFRYWKALGDSIQPGQCMQELLERVRRHKVNIDGDVCTVMVTTLVLEVKLYLLCSVGH
jgi:aarF domain-containing kinase